MILHLVPACQRTRPQRDCHIRPSVVPAPSHLAHPAQSSPLPVQKASSLSMTTCSLSLGALQRQHGTVLGTELSSFQRQTLRPISGWTMRPQRPLRCTLTIRADNNNGARPTTRFPSFLAADSDVTFVLKLAAVSFTTGAAIKYGSLLLDAPFQHDPVLALTIMVTPPTLYAAYLLWRQLQR